MGVQQELIPRVGINVSYHRRWFGNFYTVDDRATVASDYTPFSIPIPIDPRLPGGGGGTVTGLYNLVPTKVGQVDQLAQHAKNFGDPIENWHGVDVGVSARLQSGITIQGGTSTGRRLQDNCAVRAQLPEAYSPGTTTAGMVNPYCRVVDPFQTSIRGLATYTIPVIGVQVSGTWRSDPGPELAANYVVASEVAFPSLGRNLSAGNVTVNLIEPGTLYGDRNNNLDFRVSKILRYGRTRTQVGLDIYNLTNTDVVTGYNQGFVPNGAWLTPTTIQPARYVKLSAQFDF